MLPIKNRKIVKFSLLQGLAETCVCERAFWIVDNFSISEHAKYLKYTKEKRHLNVGWR
tara:strand:+ start:1130 stop:1303 length:174 start_codon:yes stop_codon:yes gene_type:complete